jgi:hypothetical protein
MNPIVAILSPAPSMEAAEEGLTWHMPLRLKPFLDPFARTLPFLASGAAFDAWHSLSVFCPEKFAAQNGEPARQARMNATEAPDAGLLRRDLQCEFPQSLREHLVKPFRIAGEPKGAHNVVSVSADQRFAATVRLDHLFTPSVQRLVQIDVGPHG